MNIDNADCSAFEFNGSCNGTTSHQYPGDEFSIGREMSLVDEQDDAARGPPMAVGRKVKVSVTIVSQQFFIFFGVP